MIDMGVGVQKVFHVRRVKAERADVLQNLRRRLGNDPVQEEVAIRSGDQIGAYGFGADIVEIADNRERVSWRVPFHVCGKFVERRRQGSVDLAVTGERRGGFCRLRGHFGREVSGGRRARSQQDCGERSEGRTHGASRI